MSMSLTLEEMSRLRAEHSKNSKKELFARFSINPDGKRAVTNVAKDPLSQEDRARINEIKDSKLYPDESKDEFSA